MAFDIFSVTEKVASLVKLFNLIEERQKRQDDEITLLRKDNAELRTQNAMITERLARLEEGRNTVDLQVQNRMLEVISTWENQRLREENAALKQKQIQRSSNG